MTLDFIFRLVLCSRDDVSFNIICLNVLEDIKQFYLLIRFKKKRLETLFKLFKCDNVKALIKMSNCENLVLYFSEKAQKIAPFAMLFWFSVTKQSLENGFGVCNICRRQIKMMKNYPACKELRWKIPYLNIRMKG